MKILEREKKKQSQPQNTYKHTVDILIHNAHTYTEDKNSNVKSITDTRIQYININIYNTNIFA